MNMVIPDEGKLVWLDHAIALGDNLGINEYIVRLYSNDYTPDDDSEYGDFTPAAFDGFAPVNITAADWDPPSIVSHIAVIVSTVTPVFTCSGATGETVYGWFMSDLGSTIALAAQRFDSPRDMVDGAVLALDPFQFKLKTFS